MVWVDIADPIQDPNLTTPTHHHQIGFWVEIDYQMVGFGLRIFTCPLTHQLRTQSKPTQVLELDP